MHVVKLRVISHVKPQIWPWDKGFNGLAHHPPAQRPNSPSLFKSDLKGFGLWTGTWPRACQLTEPDSVSISTVSFSSLNTLFLLLWAIVWSARWLFTRLPLWNIIEILSWNKRMDVTYECWHSFVYLIGDQIASRCNFVCWSVGLPVNNSFNFNFTLLSTNLFINILWRVIHVINTPWVENVFSAEGPH